MGSAFATLGMPKHEYTKPLYIRAIHSQSKTISDPSLRVSDLPRDCKAQGFHCAFKCNI